MQSKSWEVNQVLHGTHCRQKSNILEMATLTNAIESFEDQDEEKSGEHWTLSVRSIDFLHHRLVKRFKRNPTDESNSQTFPCTSNESVIVMNSSALTPSKRPRGRPRKPVDSASNEGKTMEEDRKPPIFYLNNQPFLLQTSPVEPSNPSRLDDAGHYLIVNGRVQPRTLNSLLKTLKNSSAYSGVDHLIDTIQRFEQSQNPSDSITVKKPIRKRLTKKMKEENKAASQTIPPQSNEVIITPAPADFNAFDLSNSWPNDPTLNSLLFHEDFHFDDFDSYLTVDQSSAETNVIFTSQLL